MRQQAFNCPQNDGEGEAASDGARRGGEGSGTLPLTFKFQAGGLHSPHPYPPNHFMGSWRKVKEGGDTSGLGKERGGRPGWRGEEEASVCSGEATLQSSGTCSAAGRWEPPAVRPLAEPRPRLCWEGGTQCCAPVVPPPA